MHCIECVEWVCIAWACFEWPCIAWVFKNEKKKNYLFRDEGDGPSEDVHEVWKVVGMRGVIKLQNVQRVVFELEDRALVVCTRRSSSALRIW